MKMKRYLKKNPDSTVAGYYMSEGDRNFNLLWFLAGLLVPLLSLFIVPNLAAIILLAISPVILALIIKRDRVTMKSVLIGFGIAIGLVLIVGLILASALNDFH
jgi:VIT1/CCC1 family predicted Fe2+/Mn2+ transporter